MPVNNDSLVWNQLIAGNEEAYASLYNKYIQSMYAYGMHFTNDNELVKDCIHDIFVKIYQDRNKLKPVTNVKVYLLIALKNKLINVYKKDIDFTSIESHSVLPEERTAEDTLIDDEYRKNLNARISYMFTILSPRQKEVLYYRYIEELTFEEIADIMEMNYQSVHNIIQRSLKKLRSTFNEVELSFFLCILSSIIK